MWMLVFIIACSPGQDFCTYRSDATVTRSFEDCQRLGHFMGGRAMVQAYGAFPVGEVEVTCRPVVPPVALAQAERRRS